MKFKCFNDWHHLPQNSNELFAQAEIESLFFSRQWFENLANTSLLYDQSLLLACVIEENHLKNIEDDKVLAILPLIKTGDKKWTSLSHIYTALYTLLLAQDNQQEILKCLANGLSQLEFESLKLASLADDDERINKLEKALNHSELTCSRYAEFFNRHHSLKDQSFNDYMAFRQSRVRNTIARKERKLKREHDYQIHLHAGDDVSHAMADFYAVYKVSWKPDERFKDVVDGFIASFSKQSWIRLAILYINEKPVAAQIWFVAHKKASIFKLAYDETWKQYSPGSILTKYLMEYVIDTDHIEEIDFQRGNDRYKQEWMSGRRQRWNMICTHKQKTVEKQKSFIERIKNTLNRKSQHNSGNE